MSAFASLLAALLSQLQQYRDWVGIAVAWTKPPTFIGLSQHEINEAVRLIQEHENEVRNAWLKHFPS